MSYNPQSLSRLSLGFYLPLSCPRVGQIRVNLKSLSRMLAKGACTVLVQLMACTALPSWAYSLGHEEKSLLFSSELNIDTDYTLFSLAVKGGAIRLVSGTPGKNIERCYSVRAFDERIRNRGGVVERTSLLKRQGLKALEGSNPSGSAHDKSALGRFYRVRNRAV